MRLGERYGKIEYWGGNVVQLSRSSSSYVCLRHLLVMSFMSCSFCLDMLSVSGLIHHSLNGNSDSVNGDLQFLWE